MALAWGARSWHRRPWIHPGQRRRRWRDILMPFSSDARSHYSSSRPGSIQDAETRPSPFNDFRFQLALVLICIISLEWDRRNQAAPLTAGIPPRFLDSSASTQIDHPTWPCPTKKEGGGGGGGGNVINVALSGQSTTRLHLTGPVPPLNLHKNLHIRGTNSLTSSSERVRNGRKVAPGAACHRPN